MDNINFLGDSLSQFMYWVHNNRKNADKVYDLIKDIARNGAAKGIGKPERLKYRPAWSRKIDDTNRLVYEVKNNNIYILSCEGHYED